MRVPEEDEQVLEKAAVTSVTQTLDGANGARVVGALGEAFGLAVEARV